MLLLILVVTSHAPFTYHVVERARYDAGKGSAKMRMSGKTSRRVPLFLTEGCTAQTAVDPSGAVTPVYTRSIRHTAWAAMPSPLPVKPRPSSVVAFTLTASAEMPSALAMFSRIAGM